MANNQTARYDLSADIVRVLREHGPMTCKELGIHVSGTRPEIAMAVKYMAQVGLLTRVDPDQEAVFAKWTPAKG